MSDRRLALAALDPNAAIRALEEAPPRPPPKVVLPKLIAAEPYTELALVVDLDEPKALSWWRFAVFWLCIKLAARVCKFKFEITK